MPTLMPKALRHALPGSKQRLAKADVGWYGVMMTDTPQENSHVAIAVSSVTADGRLIETIYDPETRRTGFVAWHNGRSEVVKTTTIPGIGRVVPYSATNNLLSHRVVLFPSGPTPYSSERDLVDEIRSFIHRYADVSDLFEEVAGYYVLFSWIYDAFSEVPYLRLKGDFGSGKSRCLQTIGSLCYKPMFASGASTVSPMFRIIDTFRGTLVIDEGDFRISDARADIIKILNNGNAAGFPVLRSEATPTKEFNPRAFTVFGPKIIASRGLFDDRALESRCITETMAGLPPRPDIPLSLPDAFHAEALSLRNKLLAFRFHNLRLPRDMERATDPDIEPRVSQVFAPLLAVVVDRGARERLVALAKAASRKIRAERSASVEAQVLDIMYEVWREALPLAVKTIAERFAERFGSDYRRPITPRWIGAQLRSRLSLTPVKSHGTFVIPATEEPRLLSLFQRYGFGDVGTSDMSLEAK